MAKPPSMSSEGTDSRSSDDHASDSSSSRTHYGENTSTSVNTPSVSHLARLAPRLLGHSGAYTDASIQSSSDRAPTRFVANTTGNSFGGSRSRRSHTKSRIGCYSCKARRIKCPQNKPVCSNCSQRNTSCEWPELKIQQEMRRDEPSADPIPVPLRTPELTFSMQDMRLFYYFIESAYPHQPIGNDEIWTREIPSISHNYGYLLHSMLALSASELSGGGTAGIELVCSAMSHRVKAIQLLNQALSRPILSFEEGNAMLATCYNLSFQSALLQDAFSEYMTFIRGIVLVSVHLGTNHMRFMFKNMMEDKQLEIMGPYLDLQAVIGRDVAAAAFLSMNTILPFCRQQFELSFHERLLGLVRGLSSSAREGYIAMMKVYGEFSYRMTQEDFQSFISTENNAGKLLQCHFVALQTLLSPVTQKENQKITPNSRKNDHRSITWIDSLHNSLPPHMRLYNEWPLSIFEATRNRQ